jgi:transcription initiation factor TFIIIB Brf1 subunit/transcription initiation factor TFIIB
MGSHGIEGSDAAISGMADRLEPGLRSHPPSARVKESDTAISRKAELLGTGSHPPSDGVEGSDAAISSIEDRLGTGSHPPSDGVKGSDAAISSMVDRLCPGPNEGVEGFEAVISGMAARLGLAADVGERAKEVFRKMDESRAWLHGHGLGRRGQSKGRSKGPLAYAACLSVVCRSEGSERSLRELALAAGAGDGGAAARKDIARLVAHIRRQLGEAESGQATGIGMVTVSSYLRRFGVLIGLGEAEAAAALEAARRLEESTLDVPHVPESVAAAVVCLALERGGAARKPEKDVATATGIAYHTINRVCMILRPHAGRLFG